MQQDTTSTSERSAATGASANSPLIASDRVEGTAVYDPGGKRIGTIKRLMIDKVGGGVAYAVMAFGGFLGMGQDEYPIPWDKLEYDPKVGGFRTDITQDELKNAPGVDRNSTGGALRGSDYNWTDRAREQELHDYYAVAYYWEE